MDAILVDQVTALYVVLAVAMMVLGGTFLYLWRLNSLLRQGAGPYALGTIILAVLILAFGGIWMTKAITQVETALLAVMVAVLAVWIGLFSYLWRLDRAT